MNAVKVHALLIATTLLWISQARAQGTHWSYEGPEGPARWGDLDASFLPCKRGKFESPIDIRGARAADLAPLEFAYQPSPLEVIDNGHTVQVNYAPGSSLAIGGKRYELVQLHFHKPSEEKIDGTQHAMVVHLVHRGADGKLAVVAVLLDEGGANPTIDAIWNNLPKDKEEKVSVAATIDATALLPGDRGYYTFQGSLTTPPCSEDVRWFVLKTPSRISSDEIAIFGRRYPMNARPTQPLHGRTIEVTR